MCSRMLPQVLANEALQQSKRQAFVHTFWCARPERLVYRMHLAHLLRAFTSQTPTFSRSWKADGRGMLLEDLLLFRSQASHKK